MGHHRHRVTSACLGLVRRGTEVERSRIAALQEEGSIVKMTPGRGRTRARAAVLTMRRLSRCSGRFLSHMSTFMRRGLSGTGTAVSSVTLTAVADGSILCEGVGLLANGSPVSFLTSTHVHRTYRLLRDARLLIGSVDSHYNCADRHCFDHTFGHSLGVDPSRCHSARGVLG